MEAVDRLCSAIEEGDQVKVALVLRALFESEVSLDMATTRALTAFVERLEELADEMVDCVAGLPTDVCKVLNLRKLWRVMSKGQRARFLERWVSWKGKFEDGDVRSCLDDARVDSYDWLATIGVVVLWRRREVSNEQAIQNIMDRVVSARAKRRSISGELEEHLFPEELELVDAEASRRGIAPVSAQTLGPELALRWSGRVR